MALPIPNAYMFYNYPQLRRCMPQLHGSCPPRDGLTECSLVILSNSSMQHAPRSARTTAPASKTNSPVTASLIGANMMAFWDEGEVDYQYLQ